MSTIAVIVAAIVIGFVVFYFIKRSGGAHGAAGGYGGRKKCGYCRASVKADATFCPKCGYEFIDF